MINYDNQTEFTRWIKSLDKRFWCPDKRELIILFWYMSSWKTEYAYHVARANKTKTLFLSLELPEYDMKLRICRKRAGVSKYDFQKKNYTEQQKEIMDNKWRELENDDKIKISSPTDKWLPNLISEIMHAYDEWCRMFIIDDLDKIPAEDNEDENKRYQRITSTLQDFKNNNDACIILLHHAKKPNDKNVYRKAGMAWMRWSQKIMDNATQVFEISRDLDPDEQDHAIKAQVEITQLKDTFEWANWFEIIYFYKGDYYDETGYKTAKYEA